MKSSSALLLAVTLMSSSISIMGYQGLYNGKWTIKSNSVAFAQTPTTISITSPQHGSRIQCSRQSGGQCYFTVQGRVSNLSQGNYLSLMLTVPGGGQWWHSGNSINPTNNTWNISMVSVDPNTLSDRIEAVVIVTSNSIPPGEGFDSLPPHDYESARNIWLLPN